MIKGEKQQIPGRLGFTVKFNTSLISKFHELEDGMKKSNFRHKKNSNLNLMLPNFIFRFIIRERLVKHF